MAKRFDYTRPDESVRQRVIEQAAVIVWLRDMIRCQFIELEKREAKVRQLTGDDQVYDDWQKREVSW